MFAPLKDLAADLAAEKTSSEKLTEEALARIGDAKGEGGRTYTDVFADAARAETGEFDHEGPPFVAAVLLRKPPVASLRLPSWGRYIGIDEITIQA